MGLLALGINHTTASLEVREKVAFSLEQLHLALEAAQSQLAIDEIAILSTCNRSEIYCHGNADISVSVLHWLAKFHGLEPSQLEDCHYCYHDEEAIMHMMRVATGLDSMVLGEPQILGQLKSAYATAQACQSLGSELELLFQHTFSVAKQARTDTAIGENPVSVAYAAVSLAEQIFANISENRALLIGAGKTIELVAQHLQRAGVTQLTVANRTLERANELAAKLGAQAILLADIPEHLAQADIVISSTASQLPILGKGSVEKALKQRKHRPIFMVDIAVPRDIEVEVAELNDIYLYSVDDLKSVIDDSLKTRQSAAEDAEKIILQGCQSFLQKRRERDALGALRQYRQQAEALRDQELAKATRKLEAGATPEEAMALLARNLTNKLIHPPSVAMKKASADGNHKLLNWAKNLLGLKDHPEKATTD